MNEIEGNKALTLAKEISKLPDGCFIIAFFKYNTIKDQVSDQLRVIEGCKTRAQLPNEVFNRDPENYFLFQDNEGNPKTAYKILIRFIGFSHQGNKLRKINWT